MNNQNFFLIFNDFDAVLNLDVALDQAHSAHMSDTCSEDETHELCQHEAFTIVEKISDTKKMQRTRNDDLALRSAIMWEQLYRDARADLRDAEHMYERRIESLETKHAKQIICLEDQLTQCMCEIDTLKAELRDKKLKILT